MIDSIDPSNAKFLADLSAIQLRQQRAQRQISSGLKITSPSDSPQDVRQLLQAQADLGEITQIHTNLGRVKSEVDLAEGVLENAVKAVERVQQLGTQGATGTQTPENRKTIAIEIQAIQRQLVDIASTSTQGRYVFGGDQDQIAPYTIGPAASPTGVSSNINWNVTQATRRIMHPSGSTFPISKTAREIFDSRDPWGNPAEDNVFAAVNGLRAALENGPVVPAGDPQYQTQSDAQQTAINNALASLQKAGGHLNSELAFYGTVQNQVAEAMDGASRAQTRDKTALGSLQDADLPAAILEMTQAQTAQQATLSARAKLPRSSLFDYLG